GLAPPDLVERFGKHHRVMPRQPLHEKRRRHADHEFPALVGLKRGGLEPGGEAVRADLALDERQHLVPDCRGGHARKSCWKGPSWTFAPETGRIYRCFTRASHRKRQFCGLSRPSPRSGRPKNRIFRADHARSPAFSTSFST